ncbi:MAG: DMT family transporter, partial [Bryobacteraceae bacterium]
MKNRSGPARWQADLSLAGVALIWGSTFVLVKSALDDISTLLFLALRFGIASAILLAVFLWRRAPGARSLGWKGGILTGCFLLAGYVLQTVGLRYTTAAKSGFITGLYIVLVPLLAAAVFKRVPEVSEAAGAAIATAGLALMTLEGPSLQMGAGDLLTLGCAAAFAVHILLLGHYSQRIPYEWLSLLQIATCAAAAFGLFWWVEDSYARWTPRVLAALGVTSVLGTALAFAVQTWAQRYTSPTRTALIFALEPVFAWLTSFLLVNEVL